MIQNENSGLYMEVKDANAENAANVQQWGAESWQHVIHGEYYQAKWLLFLPLFSAWR